MVGWVVLVCEVVVWGGRVGGGGEAGSASESAAIDAVSGTEIRALKVTILSTMLADEGIGEWGFAALVEADGRCVLVDTGARPQTVLQNARELNVDLSAVKEVVLTHNHSDHGGGLMTLRKELMKTNPSALSRAHVAKGIFYSRPSEKGTEENEMGAMQKEYEATGGTFIEHDSAAEIFPGAWLTGPVPREFPARNSSVTGKQRTPAGRVDATIPEGQALVLKYPHG